MKKLAIFSAAVAVLLTTVAISANAEEGREVGKIGRGEVKKIVNGVNMETMMRNMLNFGGDEESGIIRASGDFQVHGAVVNSVNAAANTVNISFFGLSRDVSLAGARLLGAGRGQITINDIKAGDRLSGNGNFNRSTQQLTVKEAHDKTAVSAVSTGIRKQIEDLLEQVRRLRLQLQGGASLTATSTQY